MSQIYPLILDDGGRNLSLRPMQQFDCTVRALAIVMNVKYDICYDVLKTAGRKSHEGFDLASFLSRMGVFYGWSAKRVKIRRLTLAKLFASRPKGRLIAETSDHVIAILDGKAHDLIRLPQDCRVHALWEFQRSDV